MWWKDLRLVRTLKKEGGNWFEKCFTCKLGNDYHIYFWRDKWIGPEPLCSLFTGFHYRTSIDKLKFSDMGRCTDNVWRRNLGINLSDLDEDEVLDIEGLLDIFHSIHLEHDLEDFFIWWKDVQDFSMKESYDILDYLSD